MSLTPDPVAALAAQLRAQSPNADWNNGGIDRAAELAAILNSAGMTDLSQFKVGKFAGPAPTLADFTTTGGDSPRDLSPAEQQANLDLAMKDYNKLTGLYYGDKPIGELTDPTFQYGVGDGKLAWSADGKGHVNYYVQQNPDGTTSLVPSWQSSSDAGVLQDLGLKGAIFAGGAAAAGAFGGAGAASTAGNGAFLGEGVASGVPAWDAAAGSGVLGGAGAVGNGAFLGEGAASGVPAWDAAAGSGVLAPAVTSTVTPAVSGSGLLGDVGKWAAANPSIAKLIGAGVGGLIGKAVSGTPDNGSASPASVVMNPQKFNPSTYTMADTPPSQGLANGLGSSSAGLFDEYMKKQLSGGRRIYSAPTFGG